MTTHTLPPTARRYADCWSAASRLIDSVGANLSTPARHALILHLTAALHWEVPAGEADAFMEAVTR